MLNKKLDTTKTEIFENRNRPLWDVKEVASYLRVSVRTVRGWVFKRQIPFRKACGALRFEPDEIKKWTRLQE